LRVIGVTASFLQELHYHISLFLCRTGKLMWYWKSLWYCCLYSQSLCPWFKEFYHTQITNLFINNRYK
jgi:hypothetical protein